MKILTVVGARPQFVKAAALSRAIRNHNTERPSQPIAEKILHTGQHFDDKMSSVFFREMEIPEPDIRLDIHSLPHGAMTGRMTEQIETVLMSDPPDTLVVFGDTNSTLAGALAASKLHIPVVHIEAGLRSGNRRMPEEINRILTDQISDILCCPTQNAVDQLARESVWGEIVNTGDIMLDTALYYGHKANQKSTIASTVASDNFILATVHRAENTDNESRLRGIVSAINQLHKDVPVILPLHPRTRQKLLALDIEITCSICDPLGYFDMLWLLQHCELVLTDSGGVQKESFFFKKPCITLRDETEWTELLPGGHNTLAGSNTDSILNAVYAARAHNADWSVSFYGDGHAADKIVRTIYNAFA